jgi:single-strand DNA-binding protein
MNTVILLGRLTADPDIRSTRDGKAVASFSIAVNRFGGNGDQTDFVPIVAWEKLAEICGNNLGKGRRVLVEGRLQIRSYDGTDGQKKRVTEIVAQNIEFLDSKGTEKDSGGKTGGTDMGSEIFPEEEIPF